MIQGLDFFRDYFKEFKDDYIIIGGLATAMNMHELGFVFRATKDIDLVVVTKDNEIFLKRLLLFIKEAKYQTKQRTNNSNRKNLFRFLNSDNKNYPEQIELFASYSEDSVLIKDNTIIPIKTPQYYDYLSAILLNGDYYNLLLKYTAVVNGLHIATPEVLIPLKAHAYLNLTTVGSSSAKKHLNDIVKLATILDEEKQVILDGLPKEDMQKIIPVVSNLKDDRVKQLLKSVGINRVDKELIIEVIEKVYTYGVD